MYIYLTYLLYLYHIYMCVYICVCVCVYSLIYMYETMVFKELSIRQKKNSGH